MLKLVHQCSFIFSIKINYFIIEAVVAGTQIKTVQGKQQFGRFAHKLLPMTS